MPNGELGAFVSAVNQAKYNQILGEVKEGLFPPYSFLLLSDCEAVSPGIAPSLPDRTTSHN